MPSGQQANRRQKRRRASRRTAKHGAVTVTIPQRTRPVHPVARLGPTNSGKTRDALQTLIEHRSGVYAAPLRMLAQEAHARLSAELGDDMVGLRTGEERINEHAPVLCCTPEMAPMHGDLLIIDEVHWIEDSDRGHAWTRLLAAADFHQIVMLGAVDALPVIQAAFPDVHVNIHQRLSPLQFTGATHVRDLQPKTAVIAFSRNTVRYLTAQIAAARPDLNVVGLYGAMPVPARRTQIDAFNSGAADVIVATDVLGHGVNLPCQTVLFAETDKFDGTQRRRLDHWEVAQIAGRAGRYGITDHGNAGVLTGVRFITADPNTVRRGLQPNVPIADGLYGYRKVTRGQLRPTQGDIDVQTPNQLPKALAQWHHQAADLCSDHPWLDVADPDSAQARIRTIIDAPGRVTVDDAWTLMYAPLDPAHPEDRQVLRVCAAELAGAGMQLRKLLPDTGKIRRSSLTEAERAARLAQAARWCANQFTGLSVTAAYAAQLEHAAGERCVQLLADPDADQPGLCVTCQQPCPPWFTQCDSCHHLSD